MSRIATIVPLIAIVFMTSQLHGQPGSPNQVSPMGLPLPSNEMIIEESTDAAAPSDAMVVSDAAAVPEEMLVFAPPLPWVASVHETGQPSSAAPPRGAVLIREARFSITVAGTFDPRVPHQLIAYFDGEEIGRTQEVPITQTHTFSTSTGFPPGKYRLTVRAVQPDGTNPSAPTCPVLVDYQPTYTRKMQRYCVTPCCLAQVE